MAKDPLTGVQELAQRILDDAQTLVEEAGSSSVKILNEGTALTHDAVQVGLDTIAEAHNALGLAAAKLRNLRGAAPAAPNDPSAPPEPAPVIVPPGVPGTP